MASISRLQLPCSARPKRIKMTATMELPVGVCILLFALAAPVQESLWRISHAAPLVQPGESAWLAATAEHRRWGAAHAGSDDWWYSLTLV